SPMQNRTGNYVAWDYSYNMLMSCAPNGIIFTNGDNDTFPLWYLQEVEGVRKDVRVTNLSLLNTGWYIKQLRDREPRVPISFNDAYIDRFIDERDATALLSRYWPKEKQRVELETPHGKMVWNMPATLYVPYKQGERDKNFLRVQDMMVLDIIRTNYDVRKTPNPRPIYFAVTVASTNLAGLRDYLTMEGLAFRLNPAGGDMIDPERMFHNIAVVYRDHYRGLNDPKVHFDDNIQRLLQNYRSSFLQLAYHYMNLPEDTGRSTLAYSGGEVKAEDFKKLSNRDKALFLLDQMEYYMPEKINPILNTELSLQLGKMYYDLGRPEELRWRVDQVAQQENIPPETLARYAAILYQVFQDSARVHRLVDRILQSKDTPKIAQAASVLYGVRAYDEAARLYEYALKENAEDGQTVGALVQCYERTRRYEEAVRTIRKWLQAHPNDAGAASRLDHFEKLMATAPSDTEAQ
ncbi:MAG: tetratricopeptide repeat protein, partial [Calditrichaeota bacterium]|nr:tetratricopeptide repeat protein [Calditrichota bacterium]